MPLAGFRSEARELLCAVRGYGDRTVERRVVLRPFAGERRERVRRLLRDADLVILATGYRPAGLSLRECDGSPIALGAVDGPGRSSTSASQVKDVRGRPVLGVYATGLERGLPARLPLRGGILHRAANGLSLWQTDIGAQITRAVLARATSHPVHEVACRLARAP